MAATRTYTQRSRAVAAAQTRTRILAAVRQLAEQTLTFDPTLDAVAAQAEVSVQTVIRHFGNRERLFDAAVAAVQAEVVEERAAPVGDVAAAVRAITGHYETRGDFVLAMLSRETFDQRIAQIVASGRSLHRAWVEQVFQPYLDRPSNRPRAETLDLLVVATDVFTWKLLRRDRRLSAAVTRRRITRLVTGVLDSAGRQPDDGDKT